LRPRPVRKGLWPLDAFKANPANPKGHDLGMVITSIKTHGFVDAPVIDDRTGLILGGHGRVEALLAMHKAGDKPPAGVTVKAGKWCIPIQHARTRNDGQAAALMLALNRTVELGGSDDEKLAALLKALHASGDLPGSGYDSDDLDQLLKDLGKQDKGEDEIPEPPKKAVTKPGQLWLLGEHRLLCGDAMKAEDVRRVMNAEKAGMAFTDPPFEMAETGYMRGLLECCAGPILVMHSDKGIAKLAGEYTDIFRYCLVHYYSFGFLRSRYMPQIAHHLIGVFGPAGFQNRRDGFKTVIHEQLMRNRLMKYQKPIALVKELIRHYCESGGLVLDPFGGSGTSLMASATLGCKCYLIEVNPAMCDIIVQRWEQHSGKKAVLCR
jgi:hypothetical protein